MTTLRIQAWYQNPEKHLILAQFSNSPWTDWDTYAGSKFVVEFHLGLDPVIGRNTICRSRIGKMLTAADREEIRTIQDKVISSLQRPPKNYGLLNGYLKEFKSIDQPYGERDDIWFRYASKENVDR